jgi:hypothetical protein
MGERRERRLFAGLDLLFFSVSRLAQIVQANCAKMDKPAPSFHLSVSSYGSMVSALTTTSLFRNTVYKPTTGEARNPGWNDMQPKYRCLLAGTHLLNSRVHSHATSPLGFMLPLQSQTNTRP